MSERNFQISAHAATESAAVTTRFKLQHAGLRSPENTYASRESCANVDGRVEFSAEFLDSLSIVRRVKLPKLSGMGPLRERPAKSRACSAVMVPMAVGIVPEKEFEFSRRVLSRHV